MPSDKPFKTLDELCALAIDKRGLTCCDREAFKKYLARTNYYRFSGYAREFQQDPKYGDNTFLDGASFEGIKDIIRADSELRHLLRVQLDAIEIAVRAEYAHEGARKYGAGAFYLDTNQYDLGKNDVIDLPTKIVNDIVSDLSRDKSSMTNRYIHTEFKDDTFENRQKRFSDIPVWVAIEVVSFGRVSNMIGHAKDIEPAKCAAAALSVQWGPFAEIIHSFSVLRNLCAHHRQLWHRRMGIQCPVQRKLKPRNIKFDQTSVYAHIIMANHYRKKIDGDESTAMQIQKLIDSNPVFAEGIYRPNPK